MSVEDGSERSNVALEDDRARLEVISQLRGSISAYKGHLTRRYNEIISLFADAAPVSEIMMKKNSLDDLFSRYVTVVERLLQTVEDLDDKERVAFGYQCELDVRCLFQEEFSGRIRSIQGDPFPRSELSSARTPHEKPREFPRGIGSNPPIIRTSRSGSGSDSGHSKGSQAKLAVAQLKIENLREQQRLKEKRHELDKESLRVELQMELLNARADAEQAKIELSMAKELSEGLSNRSISSLNVPKQTLHETVGKYLESYDEVPRLTPTPLQQPERTPYDQGFPRHSADSINVPEVQRFLQSQQEAIKQRDETVRLVATGLERLEMPKRELMSFDGDPKGYPRFIKGFEVNVERRVKDYDERLNFLIQYCRGAAKEAIENCIMLPPEQGYREAKDILRKNFGQKHIVVCAFIDKVIRGPQIRASEPDKLSQLARDMRNCILNSEHMHYQAGINSMDTLKRVVMRLPSHLQAKWAEESSGLIESGIEPEFSHLTKFVERRAVVANTAFGKLVGTKPDGEKDSKPVRRKIAHDQAVKLPMVIGDKNFLANPDRLKVQGRNCPEFPRPSVCLFCDGSHTLEKCFRFRDRSYKERKEFVLNKRLCMNCLKENHVAKRCRLARACMLSGCARRHHSLLHPAPTLGEESRVANCEAQRVPVKQDPCSASGAGEGQCTAIGSSRSRVGFRVVPVRVRGCDGGPEVETCTFSDNGSDTTLYLKGLVHRLGLNGTPKHFTLSSVNSESSPRVGYEVGLDVMALNGDDSVRLDKVWTMDHLPVLNRNIPCEEDVKRWPHLRGIEFPKLDGKAIEILIGNDVPEAHWVFEQRRGRRKQPYAVRTPLGWTLIGPLGQTSSSVAQVNFVCGGQEMLSNQFKRLYDAEFSESLSCTKQALSVEDHRALAILESSARKVDGHYQLALPWRFQTPCLPNNRSVAARRLQALERRFLADPALFEKYKDAITQYIANGHARKVLTPKDPPPGKLWYLLHHPVFHPQKPNKVRVVFDCAARFRETSLNDQLLQGPDLTNNLTGVLLRFRQEPVALVADVEQMFHQVRVRPEDCDALRFLWWEDSDFTKGVVDHQMLVHLFGASSSPCCASFALKKTANDNKTSFDVLTIDTVNRNFYVDDCLKSVSTVPEAHRLVSQLSNLLAQGGFHLTKWISNCREVLKSIPPSERAPSIRDLDLKDLPLDRALGTQRDVERDTLSFKVAKREVPNTRRGMLSLISGLYDPLGFAAPFILPAKMLLQELCRQDYGWEEQIPDEKLLRWRTWVGNLSNLEQVNLPCCFKPKGFGDLTDVQLHHFSDASEVGYGAASYLRLKDDAGHIHCSLVFAKSRVAPLKTITIPRMELTAASVSAKLHKFFEEQLDLAIHRSSNPADLASRGLLSIDSEKLRLWLEGPDFLKEEECKLPSLQIEIPSLCDDDLELKRRKSQIHIVVQEDVLQSLLSRYSSLYKLQTSVAWLLRFKDHLRTRINKLPTKKYAKGCLTVKEIASATKEIVKVIQREAFPNPFPSKEFPIDEITREPRRSSSDRKFLRGRLNCIGYASPLRKLSPFLHDGVICVGGRLNDACIPFSAEHPMILPSKHPMTDLIIKDYHEKEGHVGAGHVLASLRQRFWILRGNATVRRVLGKCLKCRLWNSNPCDQIMAQLPWPRVSPYSPPFSSVGVDFFGPILVAHDLTSDSFIQAFTRFVSRRGVPIEVFSDNGTNFRGAETEIKVALSKWNSDRISTCLRRRGVQWYFNPPLASHAGGVLERMIRSIRKILRFLLGNQLVDDQTLLTFIAEVEKILNDCPLVPPSSDPRDPEPLSPSKLLLLGPNMCCHPDKMHGVNDQYGGKRWRQAQYLADIFWKRWIREYLPTLQVGQKWL
ncbi:hypothetical protein P5673_027396 [Acropora cervicornis]|uniref:Integrase catalytic domain-containing protein n=1 Tax=Acropora cervicornis TaxID=6130 RepID=A0AAD9UVM2_ACRCE|nr:hypothetical protein P5673_027396 [Acropora cervicornis]